MAFYECVSAGGTLSETLLWSGSVTTYSSGSLTLSSSYTNYDYIKIKFIPKANTSLEYETIIPKSTLENSSSVATFVIGATAVGETQSRVRGCYMASNTSINLSAAYNIGGSATYSNYILPRAIYGLK